MAEWSDGLEVAFCDRAGWSVDPATMYLALQLDSVELAVQSIHDELIEAISPQPFMYEQSRSEFEWGGSSAVTSIVVSVGEWILSGAGYDVAKAALLRLWQRHGRASEKPLTMEEAAGRSAWIVESRFGVPHDSLTITQQEEWSGGPSVVELAAPDGRVFEVELLESGGYLYVVRLKVTSPDRRVP